jgi:hypothetical protein
MMDLPLLYWLEILRLEVEWEDQSKSLLVEDFTRTEEMADREAM